MLNRLEILWVLHGCFGLMSMSLIWLGVVVLRSGVIRRWRVVSDISEAW